MVFEKLGENIESNQYYMKHKVEPNNKKVSLHLRVDPEIYNDLTKIIAIYREFGIDKKILSKSDLGTVIFKEYFDNLPDDESAILKLFSKLKAYRDGGAINGK